MRLKHKVNVLIAEDTSMKNKLFHPDDTLAEDVIDIHTKQCNSSLSVVASGNENLNFGDVGTIKGIYMRVDADANVIINGADTPIPLVKDSDADYAKLFITGNITSVNVANPSASAVLSGVYVVWGS